MPKKDKYRYLPLAVVVAVGFGLALIGKLIAEKQGISSGSSNLIFILILAVVILAYLLFHVLWEPFFEKFFGKKLTPKPQYRPDLPEDSALQGKIESFCRYSDEILSGYVSKDDLVQLHIYISQYAQGNMGDIQQKISTKGLDNFELYHYGWNIWNHFDKVVGQDNKKGNVYGVRFNYNGHTFKASEIGREFGYHSLAGNFSSSPDHAHSQQAQYTHGQDAGNYQHAYYCSSPGIVSLLASLLTPSGPSPVEEDYHNELNRRKKLKKKSHGQSR